MIARARARRSSPHDAFDVARAVGSALPHVEAVSKYDGSPALKAAGCFMAGVATHPSAEPDSLVVRIDAEAREWLLADAPHVYYVTGYYEPHPVVLVRASRIDPDALRDLLSMAWRATMVKARTPRR